ncbi:MAG: hypothetical protein ACPH4K_06800 [Flavobacteriaceae bacterium]
MSNFALMFSKGINNLIATLLTMATLLQSSGAIENLFSMKSFQNSNINLDVEGDFEEQDVEKQKDKINYDAQSTKPYDFAAEKLEHQILSTYINFIEIPFPPPDFS